MGALKKKRRLQCVSSVYIYIYKLIIHFYFRGQRKNLGTTSLDFFVFFGARFGEEYWTAFSEARRFQLEALNQGNSKESRFNG